MIMNGFYHEAYPSKWRRVNTTRFVHFGQSTQTLKGECLMKMPSALSTWCMILFFLLAGLGAFVAIPMAATLTGIFALGAAVFLFLGR